MADTATRASTATRRPPAGPTIDPSEVPRRHFLIAAVATTVASIGFAVLLQPAWFASGVREPASTAGLLLSGSFLAFSCWHRARRTTGRRRRSWLLILTGALLAVTGNVWTLLTGVDPVESPSTVSDLTITLALLLCISAVLGFPSVRRRGIDLVVMTLDGLVVGAAVLIIANTLVYAELLEQTEGPIASRLTILLIPVLDVVLVVVGLLQLLRTRGPDRGALALLALGFLSYAAADLPYAVQVARGEFGFGGPLDMGWIVGYALLALAAWHPGRAVEPPETETSSAQVRDTVLVYAVLMLAGAVQVVLARDARFAVPTTSVWLVLALAAATRQTLLTLDNNALRRGLEERVRAQTADLRRMARQTEALLASVGDGIYGVDADGRITFVNPAAASELRRRPDELLGQHAHDLFHAPDPDGTPYPYDGCYIAEAIHSGSVVSAEADLYLRGDGSTFDVEISASPVADEDLPRGAVVAFRDVTKRREVDRLKNEFLSVVSHELRTPLTSIRGSLELLDSGALGELSPQARSMTSIAVESSERLTRLINDLLDLERLEAGVRTLDVVQVESAELLTRSATEMAGLSEKAGVRIAVGRATGRVLAEPDRIVQTLTNLLSNAIKFSESGQTVHLSAAPQGGEILFAVRDQGRGIPADKLGAVFGRFEQVDSSDARQKGGTGLGLAISRGIVEHHGGRIWAESRPGDGTTVRFTLPAARATRPNHGRP